jgi:hypothetical protein
MSPIILKLLAARAEAIAANNWPMVVSIDIQLAELAKGGAA